MQSTLKMTAMLLLAGLVGAGCDKPTASTESGKTVAASQPTGRSPIAESGSGSGSGSALPVPASGSPSGLAVSEGSSSSGRSDRTGRRNRNRDTAVTAVANPNDPYAILNTRSIFVKGNQTISPDNAAPAPSGSAAATGPLAGLQEAQLVFNGAILINGEADALIEDRGSGNVVEVRVGDAVAGGKVSAITLDDLTYQMGGKSQRVEIGQNLQGLAPTEPVAAATTVPAGTAGAPTPGGVTSGAAPGAAPTPPVVTSSGKSVQDIEAALKARRNAGK